MKSIALTILGGIGLLIASLFVNMFFEAPPTRAEFNTLEINQSHILKSLDRLERGQVKIIEHLLR